MGKWMMFQIEEESDLEDDKRLCGLKLKPKNEKIRDEMMFTLSAKLTFYIPHATSLKDKRQVCRSLVDRTRRRFNASVAEVDAQDIHQTLAIGVAVVSGDASHARQSLNEIIRFMEEHADAELTGVET